MGPRSGGAAPNLGADHCKGHLRGRATYRRSRWIRSWNRQRVRFSRHRLCPKPIPQAAALLIRYPGIRLVRGYGSLLSYDGFPHPVRLLSSQLILSHVNSMLCMSAGHALSNVQNRTILNLWLPICYHQGTGLLGTETILPAEGQRG